MTLVDRFICRREGHKPCVKITNTSGVTWKSYITTCQRCGKTYEVHNTGQSQDSEPKEG